MRYEGTLRWTGKTRSRVRAKEQFFTLTAPGAVKKAVGN